MGHLHIHCRAGTDRQRHLSSDHEPVPPIVFYFGSWCTVQRLPVRNDCCHFVDIQLEESKVHRTTRYCQHIDEAYAFAAGFAGASEGLSHPYTELVGSIKRVVRVP